MMMPCAMGERRKKESFVASGQFVPSLINEKQDKYGRKGLSTRVLGVDRPLGTVS